MQKPTQRGMGLSKPTDRPSEAAQQGAAQQGAAQQGAAQAQLEPATPEVPCPCPPDREATARTEEAMAELRRAVESVASCLGTLQSTNRTLSAELRQALQESRQAAILERERAANERERIFERQNDYVAALLEERQSEAEGNPHATQASEPSTRGSGDAGEMDRLREALEEAQRKVSCLEAERERAREVLRRLQQQRDEAQQTVTRLTQEHRKQTKESGPHDGTASAKRGTRAARSKRPPPSPSRGQSEEETKPHRDGTPAAGGTDAPSPLAAALANSDPSRRKRQRHKR